MKTVALTFALTALFAGTALAADPVIVPPRPVILSSESAPAVLAAAPDKAAKKHAKSGNKTKAKAQGAKKANKAKARKKHR